MHGTTPKGRRRVVAAFAALAACALALRLWGIGLAGGIPRGRPDEDLVVLTALRMFGSSLDPQFQAKGFPDGIFLIAHAILRIRLWLWRVGYGTDVHLGCAFALHPGSLLVPVRVLSAVTGTAVLLPVAALARRLVAPEQANRAGLIGAAMIAFDYLHGRDSHFAVTDASVALLTACSVWACVRLAEEGAPAYGLGAGLSAGLACALKWHALFLLPVPMASLAVVLVRFRERPLRRRLDLALGCIASIAGGFVLLSPFAAAHPAATWAGILSHTERYSGWGAGLLSADPTVDRGIGLVFHSTVTLPAAMSWAGVAAAAIGLVASLRRRAVPALPPALALVTLYLVAVGPTRLLFVRYTMPVLPILAAFAAAGTVYFFDWVARLAGAPRRLHGPALAALAASVVAPPALRLVRVDRLLGRRDTRELAQDWLARHAPPGSTVLPQGVFVATHAVEAGGIAACRQVMPPELRRQVPALPGARHDWREEVARGRPGWFSVASSAIYDVYHRSPGLASLPSWVTQGRAVVACGRRVPGDWRTPPPLDAGCFREVARFGPGEPGCDAIFDVFDAFYLPFTGFEGVERMGPEVVVYERRCSVPAVRRESAY